MSTLPEPLVMGVGAFAGCISAGILASTFVYVLLYLIMYRVAPVMALYVGYSLLTEPVAFCDYFGLAGLAASPIVFDVVGALVVAYGVGSVAVAKTGCYKTMFVFTGACAAAAGAVAYNGSAGGVGPMIQKYAATVGVLAAMHLSTPMVSKQLGKRNPKYTGYA
ncbi:hypothetical protein JL722_3767 [Aureococcus anophagefferens]|nr:hypothetical protein JL722_3767 [Aureococcus anophagefferens]